MTLQEDLLNGEEIATCPSCSLRIRVVYDPVRAWRWIVAAGACGCGCGACRGDDVCVCVQCDLEPNEKDDGPEAVLAA